MTCQTHAPIGLIDDWPALELWSRAHLASAAGDAEVTVDVTPNGRGDAVADYGKWRARLAYLPAVSTYSTGTSVCVCKMYDLLCWHAHAVTAYTTGLYTLNVPMLLL